VGSLSIAAALERARRSIPLAEARLLARDLLGCTAAWLEAHRDDALDAVLAETLTARVAKRAEGVPIAYLTGRREFYGREFAVTPAVLIPRPETELLVDLGKTVLAGRHYPRILDLGTGSGCVAVSLSLEIPGADVTALDISADALAVARRNAESLGARVRFAQSEWFAAVPGERFDLIVANPPYVADGDPHLQEGDVRFEPQVALRSGSDGLAAIRAIVGTAPAHLEIGGRLLFEHGYDQANAVAALLVEAGFAEMERHRDLAGIVRVSGGRKS
jgi:release factor glutamine methyltransferase